MGYKEDKNQKMRDILASICINSNKNPLCFPEVELRDVQFFDFYTDEQLSINDLEPGMDIRVSDGYNKEFDLFDIQHIDKDEDSIQIETSTEIFSNHDFTPNIARQELNNILFKMESILDINNNRYRGQTETSKHESQINKDEIRRQQRKERDEFTCMMLTPEELDMDNDYDYDYNDDEYYLDIGD